MSGVTIAVGGRWREIEDENAKLRRELADSEQQLSLQISSADELSAKLRTTTSEMDELKQENLSKIDEVHSLEKSLRISAAEIADMRAAAEASALVLHNMNVQEETSSVTIQSLRQELEEKSHQYVRLRTQLASKEQALALESSLRKKAEAKTQLCHAELCTLETRFAKQGTHVQLLLRDKERLWSQLSRTRGTDPSPNHSKVAAAKPSVSKKDSEEKENQVENLRKPVRRSQSKASAVPSPSVAELERKLWHTQKALERERAAHEATKSGSEVGCAIPE